MSESYRRQRALPLSTLALAMLVFAAPIAAYAQAATYNFNIPAGDLGAALRAFARTSGQQLVYDNAVVEAKTSSALVGTFSAEDGLRALLAGSGLTFRRGSQGVFMISDAAEAPRSSEASSGAGDAAQAATANEVIVTAQKQGNQNLLKVPLPVSVVRGAQLTENGQVLLRDYYNTIPGLSIQGDIVNQQELSIRGITTGGDGVPVVGIMVDGVPFGGSTNFTAGNWLPDFDPGDLDRVEVLRGPQGTLYGANSMGGLVNFITVDPSTAGYSGRFQAGYSNVYNSSQPGFNLRGSANIPVSSTLAVRVSAFDRQDPGYIDNPTLGQQGVNEAEAYGFRIAALWTPSEDISLRVSALYQDYKQNAANDVVVGPGLGPWQQNYIAHYGGANQRQDQVYSAILNANLGFAKLTSVTGYSINKSYATLDFGYAFSRCALDGTYDGTTSCSSTGFKGYGVTGAPYIQHDDPTRVSEELRMAGSIARVDWILGAFYSHETDLNYDSVYASDPFTGKIYGIVYPFENPSKRIGEEYAGFVNATVHVTDKFDIQLGGRESHVSLDIPTYTSTGGVYGATTYVYPPINSASSVFTYLVAPEYNISQNFMIYGRASSGFRPGGGNTQPGPGVLPPGFTIPLQVAPDKTNNYELGAKGKFLDGKLTIDASIYYIDWQNLQINLSTPPPNSLLYHANGSAAKSAGIELAATAKPTASLTVSGWVAYDDAELTKPFPASSTSSAKVGDQLPIDPRYSAHLSATQEFPLWGTAVGFLGGDISYVGNRLGNFTGKDPATGFPVPRTALPAYTKVDLRAGFRVDSWRLDLFATNVGNARGLIGGGQGYDPSNAFIYITPRTVGFNVSKSF